MSLWYTWNPGWHSELKSYSLRRNESIMLLLWILAALLHLEQVQGGGGTEDHIFGRVLLSDSNQSTPPRQESSRGLNPSVVIIVVILTVVFLLSGFLHLLARCCGRVASRHEPTESAMSALHGQLQHLFHLHDSGVDQAFIDTLPVFPYKAICGLKEGTDCAVCLSEFESEDRLRLLPKCKHAFHIDCIDTWLLSHSTCPLCRCALLSDDVSRSNRALSDSGRLASNRSMGSHSGFVGDSRRTVDMSRRIASSSVLAEHSSGSELGKDDDNRMRLDSPEIQPVLDATDSNASVASVLSVKLGRVERRAHNNRDSSSILRGRCYSMGSYEYVVDPANLQVVIAPTPYPGRGRSREIVGGMPRHRSVFSDSIPELGSNPGTPADELFWATRGLATPEFVSRPDGSGTSRLNLGHLAPEASLMPTSTEVDEKRKGKDKEEDKDDDKDWVTIELEAKEPSGVVINKTILPDKAHESEESRILAGLERFFGSGWRSNVGLERLAESMLKRDKGPVDGSSRSKATSALGESQRDHSMSRRTFSFRFPVPDSLRVGRSSRRTMSDNGGFDTASKETVVFDTASSKDTGYETASKDGGFETASKESVCGLDTSSVGSFDSSWVGPPSQPLSQPFSNAESNQHAASLARKTIHWLMGRDRRVVGHANFSPSPQASIQRQGDEF